MKPNDAVQPVSFHSTKVGAAACCQGPGDAQRSTRQLPWAPSHMGEAPLINILILTINQMILCNVKELNDKPTENDLPALQFYGDF